MFLTGIALFSIKKLNVQSSQIPAICYMGKFTLQSQIF